MMNQREDADINVAAACWLNSKYSKDINNVNNDKNKNGVVRSYWKNPVIIDEIGIISISFL